MYLHMHVYAGDDDMMREYDTVESTTIDNTQEHTQDDDQPPRKRRRYYYNLLDRDISRGSLPPRKP